MDPSTSGIELAKRLFPALSLRVGSTEDDLASQYGQYPLLVSLEVVEHVYAPREYAKRIYDLLEPGGLAILSTPYHGYLKNVALAISGKLDAHFTALWDHGHIKFWSIKTLRKLLTEAGLIEIRFHRVGRIAPFAKAMIVEASKPLKSG